MEAGQHNQIEALPFVDENVRKASEQRAPIIANDKRKSFRIALYDSDSCFKRTDEFPAQSDRSAFVPVARLKDVVARLRPKQHAHQAIRPLNSARSCSQGIALFGSSR